MRVAVAGGTGHIGSFVASAAARVPGVEVVVASRAGGEIPGSVRFDVSNVDSFAALDDCDVVINCVDTFSAPPDELVEHCVRRGTRFLETTADTGCYLRVLKRLDGLPDRDFRGSYIPSVGIFPGVSQLVAADAANAVERCERLDLHLSWSVWSGAGRGTCEVMVRSLMAPMVYPRDGKLTEGPPIGAIVDTSFFDRAPVGIHIGLPEAVLLFRSRGIPTVRTIASVRPRSPRFLLALTARLAALGLFRLWPIPSVGRGVFRLLRARLLRSRTTPLEIRAIAHPPGDGPSSVRVVQVDDAFAAGAASTAAMLAILARRPAAPRVQPIDDLLSLDEVAAACQLLGFGPVLGSTRAPSGPHG